MKTETKAFIEDVKKRAKKGSEPATVNVTFRMIPCKREAFTKFCKENGVSAAGMWAELVDGCIGDNCV